jgi:3-oxoadipate enol-lactonase
VRVDLPGAGRSRRAYAVAESAPPLSTDVHVDALLRCATRSACARALRRPFLGTLICQHLAVRDAGARAQPGAVRRAARPASRCATACARGPPRRAPRGLFEIAEAISEAALSASSKQQQPVTVAFVRESVRAQDAEGFARNCLALAESAAGRA